MQRHNEWSANMEPGLVSGHVRAQSYMYTLNQVKAQYLSRTVVRYCHHTPLQRA